MPIRILTGIFFVHLLLAAVCADGPADNLAANVRRIPKLGIDVPAAERQTLTAELDKLNDAIGKLRERDEATIKALLPDVEIYAKAVHDALAYQEFFELREIDSARELLGEGLKRAGQLLAGEPLWPNQRGLVVRGYVSRIDGSVQPYGLVVPESYRPGGNDRFRVDLWFHGRGETLSEVNFLAQRRKQPGQFTPPGTIVLHPYGRYSNAFKFAGEVDVLEALESVQSRYRVDEDRIAVRGFSMGGAACWQFAVHYPDRWFAANPGAGFAETPEFLKSFQQETLSPTWYEQQLWQLYDCTGYARNLLHCPTVAYSGELDAQKQAADIMAQALRHEAIELRHIIGPGTKHAYHPQAAAEVERLMASIAERGRERLPSQLSFVTYTLKYNRMHWLTVDAIAQHWKQARVDAALDQAANRATLKTENLTALTLAVPAGWSTFKLDAPVELLIDGQRLAGPQPLTDRSWNCSLHRAGSQWQISADDPAAVRKRHNLQGPIDDAFMDSFIFVRPSGKCAHAAVELWTQSELAHAIEHWRRHFRGEARVKDDAQITDEDIAGSNLVLWGDAAANSVLRRIVDRLPIRWDAKQITAGQQRFPADHHAPLLICPNPLNPRRYVVLNSGFTFREYDYLNNARQVPKLPDWAVVDLRTPPDSRYPGKVVAADFFNEEWGLRPDR